MKNVHFARRVMPVVCLLASCFAPMKAQGMAVTDSLWCQQSLPVCIVDDTHGLKLREVLIPTAVVGVSALYAVGGDWFSSQRECVQDALSGKGRNKVKIDDYLQYSQMVAVYGLNLAGVKGAHSFKDRTIILAIIADNRIMAQYYLASIVMQLRIWFNPLKKRGVKLFIPQEHGIVIARHKIFSSMKPLQKRIDTFSLPHTEISENNNFILFLFYDSVPLFCHILIHLLRTHKRATVQFSYLIMTKMTIRYIVPHSLSPFRTAFIRDPHLCPAPEQTKLPSLLRHAPAYT